MTLPPLILLQDFGGDWKRYEDALYEVFLRELAQGQLNFRGVRVGCRRIPETNQRWASFWHLVQEGAVEEDRLPDIRRCERISWIRYVIENAARDPSIEIWEQIRGSERNVCLWLNEQYIVILGARSGYFLLRSAFCTDRSHRVATYRRERDTWQAAQAKAVAKKG